MSLMELIVKASDRCKKGADNCISDIFTSNYGTFYMMKSSFKKDQPIYSVMVTTGKHDIVLESPILTSGLIEKTILKFLHECHEDRSFMEKAGFEATSYLDYQSGDLKVNVERDYHRDLKDFKNNGYKEWSAHSNLYVTFKTSSIKGHSWCNFMEQAVLDFATQSTFNYMLLPIEARDMICSLMGG